MKHCTKKLISVLLTLCLVLSLGALAAAEDDAPTRLLEAVKGSYDELFAVICDEQYDQLWLDDCAAIVGEELAPLYAEMLKTACAGTLYGEEAVAAYAENPESAQFDCFFISGVRQFVFDGSTVSGLDEQGETVFSHEYRYAQELSIAGMMDGFLYETEDEDAGEFRYIFLLPDTPETTYHIEFRYGSDIDALTEYAEGPYAYWLAAGIPVERDEALIENVIGLFVEENLAELNEQPLVYGTMNIPYADFFAGEGVAYTVDSVSSATASKWDSEKFATGAFRLKHENDDGGDILGVIFPVGLTEEELAALGEDNYAFTPLDEAPAAYKRVTVADGAVSFSAVQGETQALEAEAVLTTRTVWGDYEIDVDAIHNTDGNSDIGPIYGVLLTTEDGAVYALRHLENIWLDELSWSSGILVEEPHGNVMSYEGYADLMGKTITAITYITDSGYHVLSTELYVPVKFVGGAEVESVEAAAGAAAIRFTDLPADYEVKYAVNNDLAFTVKDGSLTWEQALPGAYTLTVSDESGKYAELDAAFVLSTDALPVAFDAESGCLVAAEGFGEDEAAAFLRNLASVTVNGERYAASGRGAVAIIDSDGEVDTEAVLVKGRGADAEKTPIFPASGDYAITVEATGFTRTLDFTLTID